MLYDNCIPRQQKHSHQDTEPIIQIIHIHEPISKLIQRDKLFTVLYSISE